MPYAALCSGEPKRTSELRQSPLSLARLGERLSIIPQDGRQNAVVSARRANHFLVGSSRARVLATKHQLAPELGAYEEGASGALHELVLQPLRVGPASEVER